MEKIYVSGKDLFQFTKGYAKGYNLQPFQYPEHQACRTRPKPAQHLRYIVHVGHAQCYHQTHLHKQSCIIILSTTQNHHTNNEDQNNSLVMLGWLRIYAK